MPEWSFKQRIILRRLCLAQVLFSVEWLKLLSEYVCVVIVLNAMTPLLRHYFVYKKEIFQCSILLCKSSSLHANRWNTEYPVSEIHVGLSVLFVSFTRRLVLFFDLILPASVFSSSWRNWSWNRRRYTLESDRTWDRGRPPRQARRGPTTG